jgi:hypothetical protein
MNLPQKIESASVPAKIYEPIVYQPGMRVEQGIYLNMPESVYFATPAISVSGLKKFRTAPALYKFGEHETTVAQSIGKLWHTALLEPYELEKRFMPTDLERRGTKAWAAEEEIANGRELIKRDDWDEMQYMCASIFGQGGSLRDVLTHPSLKCEVSFFWWDYPAGVFCRGRADAAIFEFNFVGDVKSCQDADEDFEKSVKDYLYNFQAAFYKRGLRKLGVPIHDFVFFAIEKKKPWLYRPWIISESNIDHADRIITTMLMQYKDCLEEDFWPGYTPEIGAIDLPEFWLQRQ